MTRFIRTSYATLSKEKIVLLALNCYTKINDNPFFLTIQRLGKAVENALNNFTPIAAIKNPTPEQTAQLGQLRQALNATLTAVAKAANDLYPTSEAALLSAGLDLVKQREKRTLLAPHAKFSLSDSTEPDTLCFRATRTPGSAATEVRYTDDPTLPPHKWRSIAFTKKSVLLHGYGKKVQVYAMCRAIGGSTKDQAFSEVISRVVQ